MKKSIILLAAFISFVALMSFTFSYSNTSDSTLEYFDGNEVVHLENIANDDGTYTVNVQTQANGELQTYSFEAEGYSSNSDCLCQGCKVWTPHFPYKKKIRIGTKCWCVKCVEVPTEQDPK